MTKPVISLCDPNEFQALALTHAEKLVIVKELNDKTFAVVLRVPPVQLEYGLRSDDNPNTFVSHIELRDCIKSAILMANTNLIYFEIDD